MASITKEDYFHHLMIIHDRLHEYVSKMQDGKLSYIIDAAQKLRILYMVKSKRNPLLKTLQELYGFDLMVRKPRTMSDLPPGFPAPSFGVMSGPTMWFAPGPNKMGIIDAFHMDGAVSINGKSSSVKRIAEVIADQMGGAHIDPEVKDDDLLPHSRVYTIGGGLTAAEAIILDTAIATITAIDMVASFVDTGSENDFLKRRPTPA